MIIEAARPVRVSEDCSGGIESCFRCRPGFRNLPDSYLFAEEGRLHCYAELPDPPLLAISGVLLIFGSVLLHKSARAGVFSGLGDDPNPPPSSFDPSRSNRAAFMRTHLAKKFWGSSILAAQGWDSMERLSRRIRSTDPDASGKAKAVANEMKTASQAASEIALAYDRPWVENRMRKTKIAFLPEGA